MRTSEVFLIAAGGALGSVFRHWIGTQIVAANGFPLGTLVVNTVGSFVIGLLAGLAVHGPRFGMGRETELLLMVGVCGGFTTFSTFSLQTFHLIERGRFASAGLNIAASVLLCLVCVWGGLALARWAARA